jgi:16S rRNA processing protein RimM
MTYPPPVSYCHRWQVLSMANNEPYDWLIGEITSPLGLKGEMKVYPHTDFPERFDGIKKIGIEIDGEVREVKVKSSRFASGRVSMALEGVDTIDDAEKLRHARLFIQKSKAVKLEKDEYFYDQLLGLRVITDTGLELGKIIDILRTGANDVYETPLAYIPAVKEYVLNVDLQNGVMTVLYRSGLLKADDGN